MRLIKSTPRGKQRVYDIEVADVHNFYANGVNVHNCATQGGLSILKDDGTVANVSGSAAKSTSFIYKDNVVYNYSSFGTRINPIPVSTTTDSTWGNNRRYGTNTSFDKLIYLSSATTGSVSSTNTFYQASTFGLTILAENTTDSTTDGGNGMVAYATTTYNTGWMHGNIKGAFLSDTSTTSVTGTELHPNGNWDFSSTNVSYISNTASGTATVVSGQLQLSGGTSNYSDHIISISTVVGKQYIITLDYVTAPAGQQIGMYHQNTNTYLTATDGAGIAARSSGTKLQWYFTAVGTTTGLDLVTTGTTSTIHIVDNWSIRVAELDRSVNNNGLAVYGTITKTAVATGADLVAYSGFSTSNYLHQPYNSALDFGTGDFSIMGWVNYNGFISSQNGCIVAKGDPNTSPGFTIQIRQDNSKLMFFSSPVSIDSTNPISTNVWNHFCVLRNSGIIYIYINGLLNCTPTANTVNYTNSSSLFIGQRGLAYTAALSGSLSLLRISTTAPSPDQILKIYNDEKALFQENSKATLYGTSSAVTALAYDDSTRLLYVGTPSGRSDFQGLERINNTTTAVTTAISASNGLIAEQ